MDVISTPVWDDTHPPRGPARSSGHESVHALMAVGFALLVAATIAATIVVTRPGRHRRKWPLLGLLSVGIGALVLVRVGYVRPAPSHARRVVCELDSSCLVEVPPPDASGAPPALEVPPSEPIPVAVNDTIEVELRAPGRADLSSCVVSMPDYDVRARFDDRRTATFWFVATGTTESEVEIAGRGCGLSRRLRVLGLIPPDYWDWVQSKRDPWEEPSVEQGRAAFVDHCERCHSLDGSPSEGASIKGLYGTKIRLSNGSERVVDAAYIDRVLSGRPERARNARYPVAMPDFSRTLSASTVSSLISFIEWQSELSSVLPPESESLLP